MPLSSRLLQIFTTFNCRSKGDVSSLRCAAIRTLNEGVMTQWIHDPAEALVRAGCFGLRGERVREGG
ncbi:MAG: hypothetical protein FJ404_11455 [Verrucomicrobia bacterium]|nr:hypothetical protein [Verrucomicrobiota bacterium]